MTYDSALAALADPSRRRLFESIRHGPKSVGALAHEVGISQPAISQHLKILRQAKLVRCRPVGTRRLYEPDGAGISALRAYFDGFWSDALAAYANSFEEDEQ